MQLKEMFSQHVSVKRIEERKDDEKNTDGSLLLIIFLKKDQVKEHLFRMYSL